MERTMSAVAGRLDFGDVPAEGAPRRFRRGLRLAAAPVDKRPGMVRGPEKYRLLELRRRQAQIRARHALGLE